MIQRYHFVGWHNIQLPVTRAEQNRVSEWIDFKSSIRQRGESSIRISLPYDVIPRWKVLKFQICIFYFEEYVSSTSHYRQFGIFHCLFIALCGNDVMTVMTTIPSSRIWNIYLTTRARQISHTFNLRPSTIVFHRPLPDRLSLVLITRYCMTICRGGNR